MTKPPFDIDQYAKMYGALLSALQEITNAYSIAKGADDELVAAARALLNGARPPGPYKVTSADIIRMFPTEP